MQGREAAIFLIPPDLLPGAVLGTSGIQAFGRKVIDKGVAHIEAQVVFDEVCYRGAEHELKWAINEMIGLPVVYVYPKTELVGKACLIEEAKPKLLAVMDFFLNRLGSDKVPRGYGNGYDQYEYSRNLLLHGTAMLLNGVVAG